MSLVDVAAELTLQVARPLFWHDRTTGWSKRLDGGTCFFLQFQEMAIGVTANHVVEAYECAYAANSNAVCQLRNSPAFDLLGAIVAWDVEQDIATFAVPSTLPFLIGAVSVDCRGNWPPPEPVSLSHLSLCGFPESMRMAGPDKSVEFRAWGSLAIVEHATCDEILIIYDPKIVRASKWAPHLPPIGFNLGGCSGGPVLLHKTIMGLHRWFAVGLIASGPREDKKQGIATEFDIIRLRRINIVQSDGTIKRASDSDTGWLPG